MKMNVFRNLGEFRCFFGIVLTACLVLALLGCKSPTSPSVPTVSSVVVSPASATVHKGGTQQFTAIVNGTNSPAQTVTWTVEGGGDGTSIATNGMLTVAANETATSLTVRATSTADKNKSGIATVTVTGDMSLPTVTGVTVSPLSASVAKGGGQQFNATVTGTNSPAQTVTWKVEGGVAGTTITTAGLLSVALNETASSLTVRATSTVDDTKSGIATVTVTSDPVTVTSVTVSPLSANVAKGGGQQFNATVTGTNSPAQTVTWSVEGGVAGTTITPTGGLLAVAANETAATLTVRATSTVDTTKSGIATVTVTNAPATVTNVSVTPANTNIDKGGSQQFNATVTGTNNPSQAVTWTVEGKEAAGTTITPTGFLTIAAGETATTLTVRATSTVDTGKSGTATVTVTEGSFPVLNGVVIINGTVQDGYTLTANTGGLFGTGTINYQWKRASSAGAEGTNITGAIAQTYNLVTADVGQYITVTVIRAGYTGSITSDAVGPVLPAPADTGSVGGTVTVNNGIEDVTVDITNTGSLILSTTGTLTVTISGSYQAYRWYVDGVVLSSETGPSLVLNGADYTIGEHRILVIVYRNGVPYSREILFTVN
jgi:hypothetical protein